MITILSYLTAAFSLYLSWEDLRHQSVPILSLLIWVILCALLAFYGNPSLPSFAVLLGISICILLYQHFSQIIYIGLADLVVLTSLSAWVPVIKLPALFLMCGTLGLATTLILKQKRFPFLPALFLATAIVFFL